MLHSDIRKPSDYVPLTIKVGIVETNTDLSFRSISKDNKKEEKFLAALISSFFNINSSTITTKEELEGVVQQMADTFERSWNNHMKLKHITKHLKKWWNQDCTTGLSRYHASGDLQHWKEFKTVIWATKKNFFNDKYMKSQPQIRNPRT